MPLELLDWGLTLAAGTMLGYSIKSWRSRPTPSQLELMHQNVALSILASGAIGRLSEDEREDLEQEVTDMMEDAFGDGAGVVVGEEVDDLA